MANAFAHLGEEMAAEHAAEADAQPVIEADGRAVEHDPEPEQGLGAGEALAVDVGIVLCFEGDVAGVERELEDVERELAGEGEVELAAVGTAEVELEELVADDLGAALGGLMAGELLVEEGDPAAVELFGLGLRVGEAGGLLGGRGDCGFGHTHSTIHLARKDARRGAAAVSGGMCRLIKVSEQYLRLLESVNLFCFNPGCSTAPITDRMRMHRFFPKKSRCHDITSKSTLLNNSYDNSHS